MIPVALPGGDFYPALAVSLVCLATLLTWVIQLCVNGEARARARARPRFSLVSMGLLTAIGAIFPAGHVARWIEAREAAAAQARHTMVLAQPATVDGLSLPAGTQLRVAQPGRLDTFEQARFPAPVEVAGVPVLRLTRYLEAIDAQHWRVSGVSARLARDAHIGQWRCAASHQIELRSTAANGGLKFSSCHLAAGNPVPALAVGAAAANGRPAAGAPATGRGDLPSGTWVSLREGAALASDPTRATGWLVHTDGSEAVDVAGLPLHKADLRLDLARQLVSFEGALARELVLGPMTYPAGTRVASATPAVHGAQPGDLVFSPARGRAAQRREGAPVTAGHSVLQSPAGDVRAVISNRAAGVLDFAGIGTAP